MLNRNRVLLAALVTVVAQTSISIAAANGDSVRRKAGADEGLRQAFERAAYSLEDSGRGTWRGVNPAQRLTLEFDSQGARLNHPDGSVSFHLAGYGYGDRLRKPARAKLTGNANRVEYQRGDLIEWYVNGSQGLEQGFTLAHRPGTGRERAPLVVVLDAAGGLLPARKADSVLFESGNGVVLRYAGLEALDARGRILPSRLELRGREIRLIVEDRDAQYPLVIDPTWTQQQELAASDGAANDLFGFSVAASGDTAVIGAFHKTFDSQTTRGTAYVFVRSGGVWSQQQELTASDGAAGDEFGTSVSVDGDTAVIGASGKSGAQGAAYVFVRSGGVWSQQQELTASDGAANDYFGSSVLLSGQTAVVGAFGNNSLQGAAYVFVGGGGVWTQQQELTASDGAANSNFGISVSLSGDTAAIGAPGSNPYGAAYVFVRSGGVWSQQQELAASDGTGYDGFGNSVSVCGDTVMVGANGRNGSRGAVYAYVRSGGVWSQQQELTADDGVAYDEFGYSVSLSGDAAGIGAPGKNSQGAIYVFGRSGGAWNQQHELTASDGAAYDNFGAVSVSGNTAVIGAYAKNGLQGAAYVFVCPSLGTNALLVGGAGGTSSVVLTYDGAWTATANDSFLHISPGSANGTGSATVVFTYDAFTGTGTRTGTLTVAGLTVTVTQAGTDYIGPGAMVTLVSASVYENVAVDGSGNVYFPVSSPAGFAETIQEWNASTQQVTTLVSWPSTVDGVAVDGSGNVYFVGSTSLAFPCGSNGAIEEWSPSTQQVTELVGPAVSYCGQIDYPNGVAVDGSGNVYYTSHSYGGSIWERSSSTYLLTMLVSGSPDMPWGVAVDRSGNVYFTNGVGSLYQWSASTQQTTPIVSGAIVSGPSNGVAVDGSGNVYFPISSAQAIYEWSASTQQVTTLVPPGSGLWVPMGVAVDGSGNVYIADWGMAIYEVPNAFVGPARLTEAASAGSDSLLPVLPSTASLTGVFAPASDQGWLTIGAIANGVIGFAFTANTSSSARVGHITVLGQQITVMQSAPPAQPQTIAFGPLSNQMYGVLPFTVSASASSGLPVSFNPQTPTTCAVSGTIVTLVAVGVCTIQATQAGNTAYAAAPSVSQDFQVTPFTCAITGNKTAGVADVQLVIEEALGVVPTVHDMNHDGVVNVADVQKVVDGAVGLACPYQ